MGLPCSRPIMVMRFVVWLCAAAHSLCLFL